MNALDEELDEQAKTKILENCGRTCISRSFVKKAQDYKKKAKNMDDFLNTLGNAWKHLKRENNDVYVVYEKSTAPWLKHILANSHPHGATVLEAE